VSGLVVNDHVTVFLQISAYALGRIFQDASSLFAGDLQESFICRNALNSLINQDVLTEDIKFDVPELGLFAGHAVFLATRLL
jgi:hypothetical protein